MIPPLFTAHSHTLPHQVHACSKSAWQYPDNSNGRQSAASYLEFRIIQKNTVFFLSSQLRSVQSSGMYSSSASACLSPAGSSLWLTAKAYLFPSSPSRALYLFSVRLVNLFSWPLGTFYPHSPGIQAECASLPSDVRTSSGHHLCFGAAFMPCQTRSSMRKTDVYRP